MLCKSYGTAMDSHVVRAGRLFDRGPMTQFELAVRPTDIRVLAVDDSAVVRGLISRQLNAEAGIGGGARRVRHAERSGRPRRLAHRSAVHPPSGRLVGGLDGPTDEEQCRIVSDLLALRLSPGLPE